MCSILFVNVYDIGWLPLTPETAGVPWPWNVSDGSWTWELFSALPDDGNRYEVIGGKLTVSPPPKVKHQAISTNPGWHLTTWAKHSGAGKVFTAPVAVVLSTTGSYLVPDLIFIAKDRLSIIATTNVLGAPDLVVEILSPSSPEQTGWTRRPPTSRRASPTIGS